MSSRLFTNYYFFLAEFEIIGGNYYRDNEETRASNMKQGETIHRFYRSRKNFNNPEQQQYSEQYFNRNYNPNSKYIKKSKYSKYPVKESSRNVIVPEDSRQLESRNIPYSASNTFYNDKSYRSNRKIENTADSEVRRPFSSVVEDSMFII